MKSYLSLSRGVYLKQHALLLFSLLLLIVFLLIDFNIKKCCYDRIMVYLNQFCCCWSARLGSIIIGWFNIIFSASGILAIVIAFMEKSFIQLLITELINDLEHRHNDGLISEEAFEKELMFYANLSRTIPYLLFVGLIMCILSVVTNISLLAGVKRKQPLLLIPWLVYTILQVGIQFGYSFGFSIFCLSYGDNEFGAVNLVISILTLSVGVYFWTIVNSVRKDIRNITLGENNL